eukprot:GFUD01108691.1.p1 GENE.GFUD01108691.1~~GFUD01108691.1.p1  ORF type:complete len:417 (-),score=94.63 GFUD01108691.1:86-1279(-)
MNDFVTKLRSKLMKIRSKYENVIDESSVEALVDDEAQIFYSMQRWHENSHLVDADWIELFNKIKMELVIEENFKLDQMPQELEDFLKSKFVNITGIGQFSVSDIFSDDFESSVKSYYSEKIADRKNSVDEFDVENVIEFGKQKDITFYKKTFLPLAVFKTYKEKHPETSDDKELMEDVFSIGAGSRRHDLFPEVNAYCQVCCPELWETKYQRLNLLIFRKQFENRFSLPIEPDSSDSEKNTDSDSESVIEKIFVPRKDSVFNPFLSDLETVSDDSNSDGEDDDDSDEEVESKLKKGAEHDNVDEEDTNIDITSKCSSCQKTFSREDFLELHCEIFHDAKKKVTMQFVSEPVELMTSFCKDGPSKDKKAPVGKPVPVPLREPVPVKERIRRSLRYDKT